MHGSWRGKIPDGEVLRAELFEDGERARVEANGGVYDVRLGDGAVRAATEVADPERELQTAFEVRGQLRGTNERDYVEATSAARFADSAHALVGRHRVEPDTGARAWVARRVVSLATGRDRLRVGRRAAACFSACGRYFGFVTPASRALVVFDSLSTARRVVPLPFAGDRCAHLALDGGAGRAVLSLRRRVRGGKRSAFVAALSLDDARVAWELASNARPVCVRKDRGDSGGDVVWCEEDGRLEARALDDGRVLRRFGAEFDAVCFDDAGRYALLVREVRRCVVRLDLATGAVFGHDEAGGEVLGLAWEPGGKRFVQSHAGRLVRVVDRAWRAAPHEFELTADSYASHAKGVAFVPGADAVVCASTVERDGDYFATVERFSLATGFSEGRVEVGEGEVVSLTLAPDGSAFWLVLMQWGSPDKLRLDAKLYRSADARELVARSASLGAGCAVCFAMDPSDGAPRALYTHGTQVSLEAIAPSTGASVIASRRDAQRLAPMRFTASGAELVGRAFQGVFARHPVFGGRGRARPSTENVLRQWGRDTVCSVGETLIALAREGDLGVDVRQLETGRKIGGLTIEGVDDAITQLAIAPDESALLVGTRAGVVLELAIRPAR